MSAQEAAWEACQAASSGVRSAARGGSGGDSAAPRSDTSDWLFRKAASWKAPPPAPGWAAHHSACTGASSASRARMRCSGEAGVAGGPQISHATVRILLGRARDRKGHGRTEK